MPIALGKKIREVRQRQGVSQSQLAERLKYLNQSQISKIEKGDRKATAQDLIEIAKALEVSVEDIVSGSKTEQKAI